MLFFLRWFFVLFCVLLFIFDGRQLYEDTVCNEQVKFFKLFYYTNERGGKNTEKENVIQVQLVIRKRFNQKHNILFLTTAADN